MRFLEEKRKAQQITKTHFGPEETDELLFNKKRTLRQQQELLKKHLRTQIEVIITSCIRSALSRK